MTDGFISYSRRDKDFVRRLHELLVANERDLWVDWEDIPATADWWQEICEGIEKSDTFIFIISPDSVASEICFREISHAVNHNKRFVPILYRELSLEEMNQLHPAVSSHNWLFFRDTDDVEAATANLLTTLDTDLDHVREHTRLLVRAIEWDARQRDDSFMLSGTELLQAESWLGASGGKHPDPTELHTQYIYASRRHANHRQRLLLAGVTAALVIAIGLAIVAVLLYGQAEEQRIIAEDNRATAVAAQFQAEARSAEARSLAYAANARNLIAASNPNLGLRLALEGYEANSPPVADVQRTVAQAIYGAGARARLSGLNGSAIAVAFLPGSPRAVVSEASGTLAIVDLQANRVDDRFDLGGEIAVALAVTTDGERVLAGLSDGTVQIWSVAAAEVIDTLEAHDGSLTALALTPAGDQLLTAGVDRTLRLWDLGDLSEVRTMRSLGIILDLDIGPEGRYAVTGAADKTLTGTDPEEGQDRSVKVWDLATGEIVHMYRPDSGFVRAVAFHPSGDYVAAGTWNAADSAEIHLWEIATGRETATFYGHTDIISGILFNADGTRLYSISWDSSLRIWEMATRREILRFQGHEDRVLSLAISPNQEFILTGTGNVGSTAAAFTRDQAADASLWLWDQENRAIINRFVGHEDWVWAVDISPDGTRIVSGSGALNPPSIDNSVRVWDVATGAEVLRMDDHTNTVNDVAFSPDGTQIASASWDRRVIIWDAASGAAQLTYSGHADQVLGVAFSPDGTLIASASADQTIHLWEAATGELVRIFEGHEGAVNDVNFSADGTRLISASSDRTLLLWDVATGAELQRFRGHTANINRVIFTADDQHVLSTGWDSSARLWDVTTGREVRQFVGHTQPVFGAALSPDGATLLTTSADLTVRMWDVASAAEIRIINGHTNWVLGVVFSPDGRTAFSAAEDDLLIQWRLENSLEDLIEWGLQNRYVPELTCAERAQYNVEPLCDASGALPTPTPTGTPLPTPAPTATEPAPAETESTD